MPSQITCHCAAAAFLAGIRMSPLSENYWRRRICSRLLAPVVLEKQAFRCKSPRPFWTNTKMALGLLNWRPSQMLLLCRLLSPMSWALGRTRAATDHDNTRLSPHTTTAHHLG